jgi:hypothetical protein
MPHWSWEKRALRSRSTLSTALLAGDRPHLRASLCMCVSTGKAGTPNAALSTTDAVFLPVLLCNVKFAAEESAAVGALVCVRTRLHCANTAGAAAAAASTSKHQYCSSLVTNAVSYKYITHSMCDLPTPGSDSSSSCV